METKTTIQRIIEEWENATLFECLSVVANLFTIIGISIVALFTKPVVEWLFNKNINTTNFFFFGAILLFWILIFFAILVAFTYLKSFFNRFKCGLIFYYGIIIIYYFFGFAMLSSLGEIVA
jgi:hypothetical protein